MILFADNFRRFVSNVWYSYCIHRFAASANVARITYLHHFPDEWPIIEPSQIIQQKRRNVKLPFRPQRPCRAEMSRVAFTRLCIYVECVHTAYHDIVASLSSIALPLRAWHAMTTFRARHDSLIAIEIPSCSLIRDNNSFDKRTHTRRPNINFIIDDNFVVNVRVL